MKRIVAAFALMGSLLIDHSVDAQGIDSMMNLYRDNYPEEKIYVHFDKAYYNPGETIWFKAYLMSGSSRSEISRNLYAELINEKGEIIEKVAAPVANASSASSFVIPSNYASGALRFRAYTSWMLNFDTAFLFQKDIRIIGKAAEPVSRVANVTALRFFPEGGDLVADLESVVAFKANDRYGLPVKVTGYVRNNAGKKITEFRSEHNGMGRIVFLPVRGESYTAVWKDSTNREMTTALPAAKASGVVLNAASRPQGVAFVVKRSSDAPDELRNLFVIAHMNQQQVYRAKANLSTNLEIRGNVPVESLPAGMLQLTVFNGNWQPVAERIVFVKNDNFLFDTYFRSLLKGLGKREKNVIEIEVPDTLAANLSLSITDASIQTSGENENNIYSGLLLTGDLKGYVHQPGYYFSSFADSVRGHLDLVMLTHGWRRFNWADLSKGKTPEIKYPAENYLSLKGSVIGVDPSQLSGNEVVLIFEYKDSSRQFVSAPLNAGKFQLENMVFFDTARIYYQVNNKRVNASNLVLKVDNGLWKGYTHVDQPEVFLLGARPPQAVLSQNQDIATRSASLEFERSVKAKTLQEVVVRAQRRTVMQQMDERYTGGLFRGGDGIAFDLTNDISAIASGTVFNYLQGRVAGLIISNATSANPSLSWRGGSPDLYLNEMRTDVNGISGLPMADIAYIKVFRPPFFGSPGGGAGGAIAIYTKKGGERTDENIKGLNRITVPGYTPQREFYTPNYLEQNPLHDLEDLRTTLYWQPFLLLDKGRQKSVITFYNNDISKRLRVVIEGVNEYGQLCRVEEIIQ